MEPLNVECDLQSLRRLYSLLLVQSNVNKEYVPQALLLDENSQILLKRLLDSATEELLARQSKVLAQAQLGLPEKVSTPSTTKVNSVSRGIVKLPSKVGLTKEVVDSIERIETQLSAFQFCSSRGDRTRSCMSPSVVTPTEEECYSSSVMPFQRLSEKALMEPRQSYSRSRQMSHHTTRTSSIAPSLRSVNTNATVRSRYEPALALRSHVNSYPDDQIAMVRSRPPLPPSPMRSVGFEKPRQSNRTSQKMKPTLLLVQRTENGTSSESDEQVSSTDQESEEASEETVSTSGSSWETHAESVTESNSSYPSESEDYDDDDENSQVSDSPPHNRSRNPAKQRKKRTGRLKRFKDKLGKVFHHHHYHQHHHKNKEEEQGRKTSAWKHLVKKHLQKDKEKLVEKRMKREPNGLTTHNKKGGQFHTLVKGFMRHHKRRSNNKKQKFQTTPKRQGGVKFPKGRRVKLEKTNYLCNKDQEHDEN